MKCLKHEEATDEDVYTRWEKDYDLIPLGEQGLFSEYLELGESVLLVPDLQKEGGRVGGRVREREEEEG